MGGCCSGNTSKSTGLRQDLLQREAQKSISTKETPQSASKEFLDSHQYTKNGVLRYERIFGKNFISTGGITTTKQFVEQHLNLQKGQTVLDVGCGIGGSAFYMAQDYGVSVVGIDLSENMLGIAKERLPEEEKTFDKDVTVSFELCDATKKNFPENSFDVIYSRDVILHIYDKLALFKAFLKWLKPGGILFITDYCCGAQPHSAAFKEYLKDRKYHLHTPQEYTQIIEDAGFANVNGRDATEQFVNVLNDELDKFSEIKDEFVKEFSEKDYDYIVKGWKSKVVRCTNKDGKAYDGDQKWGVFVGYKPKQSASKTFLDNHQYTTNGILRYERIFGKHFVSTGGVSTTKKFVEKLNLQKGQRVLDVGCGIGGSAFYMAQNYEVNVLGIDLSENMLNIAKERLREQSSFAKDVRVEFELCDATKREFEENTFDVIYSRDTILHIYDKLSLFENFNKWLKPGGVLFITDYCCGKKPHSEAFQTYLQDRKYHLHTPEEYAQIIRDAGFVNVDGKDETATFVNVLTDELAKFALVKDDFVKEFSEKDYEYIVEGWKSKVTRCTTPSLAEADQRWGSFLAYKAK